MNGDVAVSVGGRVVFEGNSRPIELHNPLIFKDFRRNCSGGRGRKGEVPALDSRRGGKMLSCVLVSKNGCTSGVQPFVAVGMVEVPVSVDEVLDRIGANRCKRLGNPWTRAGKAGINEELIVATGKDRNISTSAHEDAYVAAEVLHSDGSGRRCFPGCFDYPII